MKVNITKKEYIKLLDVFYIADWIMHAFYSEERIDTKAYRELEQKFLSLAKEYGVDDLVEKENNEELYLPTRKFEQESLAMGFIEEYEKDSYWDELIDQLSTRDIIEKHGPDAIRKTFEDEEINNEFEDLREKYSNEFEVNGIKKLRLLNS